MRIFQTERKKPWFEGWYFKQEGETGTLALIPAYHRDGQGHASASLQIVTEQGAKWLEFPAEELSANRRLLFVRLGDSTFSRYGCRLHLRKDGVELSGALHYGPFAAPDSDMMGPFRFVPGMQCRHSVFSFSHRVSGEVTLNGREFLFSGGTGYVEGDRGCSFPSRYLWTQCGREGDCVMLSVADVPVAGTHFTGCIGSVFLGGREYRIATYRGARLLHISRDAVLVRQGGLLLSVRLLRENGLALHAPAEGSMSRTIRESLACTVRYRLTLDGRQVFDFIGERASFESVWD